MQSTLIELLGVGGVTAGATAYLNYLISKRSSKRDDFAMLLKERKEEIDFLRKDRTEIRGELEEAKERIMQLEKRVNSQQMEFMHYESAQFDSPFAVWLKDINGIMLMVNENYEKIFLEHKGYSANDYIGCDDYKIHAAKQADTYRRHDNMVLRTKRPFFGIEYAEMRGGELRPIFVVKFPRFHGRDVIGIAGKAIDLEILIEIIGKKYDIKPKEIE